MQRLLTGSGFRELSPLFCRAFLFFTLACSQILSTNIHAQTSTGNLESAYSTTHKGLSAAGQSSERPLTLDIVAPQKLSQMASNIRRTVQESHELFQSRVGRIPGFKAKIELMDERQFFLETNAPRWTNAMFFDGRILIPVPASPTKADLDNITRSVRHEYTHAVIRAASNGRCPGWLDEGIAQWAEGEINPLIQNILSKYLANGSDPVPMSLLQGGFTKLDEKIVGAAYAQSLFSANTIIKSYGFKPISVYFEKLRQGIDQSSAFESAFGIRCEVFETQVGMALMEWNRSYSDRASLKSEFYN